MRKTNHLFNILTAICFHLCALASFAQNDTSYYFFDDNFNLSGDTSAVNAGVLVKQDSLWQMTVVNTITKNIVMKGSYRSANLEREEGPFEYYFANGMPHKFVSYRDGIQNGLWKSWNFSGKLVDSIFFDNGMAKVSAVYYYDNDGTFMNYTYNNNETKEKIYKSYYPDGSLSNETVFRGKAGEIKQYYPGHKLSELVVFDSKGKRTSFKHYDEKGSEISEKAYAREQEKMMNEMISALKATQPEFKGGGIQFEAFIQRNLRLPANFKSTYHNIQAVQFSFMLNEKGKAEDLKLTNPIDVELERALLDLLANMPPWNMKGKKSYGPVNQTINIRLQ